MYSYKRSWLTVVELSIIQCITKSLEICGSEIILSYCIVSWRPLITDTTLAWLSCLDLTWLEYIYLCLVHCRPAQLTEYAINGRQSWYGCHWQWYRVTSLHHRSMPSMGDNPGMDATDGDTEWPPFLTEYAINGRQPWYGCHWQWYRVTSLD